MKTSLLFRKTGAALPACRGWTELCAPRVREDQRERVSRRGWSPGLEASPMDSLPRGRVARMAAGLLPPVLPLSACCRPPCPRGAPDICCCSAALFRKRHSRECAKQSSGHLLEAGAHLQWRKPEAGTATADHSNGPAVPSTSGSGHPACPEPGAGLGYNRGSISIW